MVPGMVSFISRIWVRNLIIVLHWVSQLEILFHIQCYSFNVFLQNSRSVSCQAPGKFEAAKTGSDADFCVWPLCGALHKRRSRELRAPRTPEEEPSSGVASGFPPCVKSFLNRSLCSRSSPLTLERKRLLEACFDVIYELSHFSEVKTGLPRSGKNDNFSRSGNFVKGQGKC